MSNAGAAKSSGYQGGLRDVEVSARLLRFGLNLWPPFLGAGVRVMRVSADYREVDVKLRFGWLNRNYYGVHYGGSLFSMTDPFFALMMFYNLGRDYVVWDKAAAIRYLKPGRGDVFAHLRLPQIAIEDARTATLAGRKHEPTFTVAIVDGRGELVAEVDKTLHIRRRAPRDAQPGAPSEQAPSAAQE